MERPSRVTGTSSRPRGPGRRARIVVGLDESPAAHAALRWAVERGRSTGHDVAAVHVYETSAVPILRSHEQRSVREGHARARATEWILAALGRDDLLHARLVVAEGSPVKVLVAASGNADLMVLGAPRPGRFRRVLTNRVAKRCSGRARCPVVLVPPKPDSATSAPEQAGAGR